MYYKGRAQCLVIRDHKILMVHHRVNGYEYNCTPGGRIEMDETPEEAAIRELKEECCVIGRILKKTSEYVSYNDPDKKYYTYLMDIDEQQPQLGSDPEYQGEPKLIGLNWLALNEMSERDRAFLWAAGLTSISEFYHEVFIWNDEISYPAK